MIGGLLNYTKKFECDFKIILNVKQMNNGIPTY